MFRRIFTCMSSLSLAALVIGFVLAGTTFAAQITFTFTGTGTGTVGGVPFTDAAYTVTLVGDTTAITSSSNVYQLVGTTATMVIAGIGTATITQPVEVYDNQNVNGLGFARAGGYTQFGFSNGAFNTYALATSLGPISGLGPNSLNQFQNLASNLGPITLSSSSSVTFVANVQLYWWQSSEIQCPIKLTYQKVSKGNTSIGTISGQFTGYMVASSNTAIQGATIEEVFLCGTLTVAAAGETLAVWLDFSPATAFSFIGTEHLAEPKAGKTDSENANVIAVGTFHDQTNHVTGPVYLNATLTLKEDTADNIVSVTVKGAVAGGYAQGTGYLNTFSSPSVRAVLTPTMGPLTCSGGTVVPSTD